jgi:dCMP deaminase
MDLAAHIGTWSKDRSTKVGCVIVNTTNGNTQVSTGCNGFPRGVDDDVEERHTRPVKYQWTEHAERNAIFNAARLGHSTDKCTMYLHWFPCSQCARAIIQAGIIELVVQRGDPQHGTDSTDRFDWSDDYTLSQLMLDEAGIKVRYWDGTMG